MAEKKITLFGAMSVYRRHGRTHSTFCSGTRKESAIRLVDPVLDTFCTKGLALAYLGPMVLVNFVFFAPIRITRMGKFQRILALLLWMIMCYGVVRADLAVDELPDLTGGVIPLLYSDPRAGFGAGGQLFSGGRLSSRGEAVYLVRVRNQSGDPIEGDSLIVVVHRIQEAARLRDVTTELEVVDSDGYTSEGKPYFRVPLGDKSELEPYGESEEFTIEIRNPNLLRLYPPALRVRGVRRTPSQAFQDTLQHAGPKDELTREEVPDTIE